MASPEEGDQRGRRPPPTDSDLSHITWTQIGTALNTVGVFLALGIAGLALGEALSKNDAAPVAATPPATTAATAPAPNPNGPIEAKLGDGTGGPPNAGSMWIALGRSTNNGGKVTFQVRNVGQLPHEFVVLKTDKSANGLGTGSRVPEDGNVGETGDVPTGGSKTLKLKLKPGHYALICNLPGHYAAGMHTDFTVK
jgi:uncharacterized cupredoxin-like copper-binding protein